MTIAEQGSLFSGELRSAAHSRNTTAFGDNMSLPVHRWFRYSAGFSAAWAEAVIDETGASHVLDPFAGSGTTVLAAEAMNAQGIGVDVHPFVVRVARAKLLWRLDPETLLARAAVVLDEVDRVRSVEMSTSPLMKKCFRPETLHTLDRLRAAVESTRQGDGYDELLWLAMVSIIRACSHVGTAQWQYVLPNKSKGRVAEPREAFRHRVSLMASDMRDVADRNTSSRGQVVEADARTLASVPDGWADLILTSPPYANNFDYADATRLEMTFLGEVNGWGELKPLRDKLLKSCSQQMGRWDPTEALESPLLEPIRDELIVVFRELDALRLSKPGHKAYNLMVLGYFFDSARVWQSLRRCAKDGAQVCYVVGDSAPYGVHVPVERWLAELALSAGFKSWKFEKVRDRNTKWENRKHRVPLHEGRLWITG